METRRSHFRYPFPTLKQCAILTVCRHWIDNRLVQYFCDGSSGLVCLECSVSVLMLLPDAINRFVDNLAVPKALKVDIYHVLNGLDKQLCDAYTGFFCCSDHKLGVYIDNTGRFDYIGFLRCCFKKNLDKDLYILYPLFSIACELCFLPEIDMVLRKIATTIDGGVRDSKMLLKQVPSQAIDGKHVVIYRFLHEADARMINRLNALSFSMKFSKCHANQNRITITLDPCEFTVDALKEHIGLLEPHLRNDFVKDLVLQDFFPFSTAYELEILEYLDQETWGWMSHYEKRGDVLVSYGSPSYYLLHNLLDWPFTQFFVPTLHLLSPHVRDGDYYLLFDSIVKRIPQKEPEYATLHHCLLHSLWSAMPLRLKQDCAYWQCAKVDKKKQVLLHVIKQRSCGKQEFLEAMIKLKIGAPLLYKELVTEMQAMFDKQQQQQLTSIAN